MIRSMSTAVTGLRGHQQKLDVIGNNIANVNTVAFKKSQARFEDLLSQTIQGATAPLTRGGINPSQVGMGMRVSSIIDIHFQGAITNTDRETDLAIEGEGFFIVSDGSREYYTRDGSFGRDANGELVNVNGLKLMGWTGAIGGELEPMYIPLGERMVARPSQNLGFAGNLDARSYFAAINEEQEIVLNGASGGTFTLDYNGATTAGLAFNATAGAVQTALEGLAGINPGDVSVSGPAGSWTVEFTGNLAGTDVSQLGIDGSALQYPLAAVSTVVDGGGGNNEIQDVDLDGAVGGTFDLTLDVGGVSGAETFTIAYNASAAAVQAALEGHTDVASGEIIVTGSPGSWTVEFVGALANTDIDEMTIDGTSLVYDLAAVNNLAQGQEEVVDTYSYEYYVFDSLGRRYNVDYIFTPQGGNTWNYSLSVTDGSGLEMPLTDGGSGVLAFTPLGNLDLSASSIPDIQFQPPGAAPLVIESEFNTVTQLAGQNSMLVREQDGYAAGELVAFYISRTGAIVGTYTNGMVEDLGQIAMAFFTNPEGLIKEGGNLYMETTNSGEVRIGLPGTDGRGLISSSSLEMSNTDLAFEFTELITTSRAFQANTRVVTTSDEVLVEVINMKR